MAATCRMRGEELLVSWYMLQTVLEAITSLHVTGENVKRRVGALSSLASSLYYPRHDRSLDYCFHFGLLSSLTCLKPGSSGLSTSAQLSSQHWHWTIYLQSSFFVPTPNYLLQTYQIYKFSHLAKAFLYIPMFLQVLVGSIILIILMRISHSNKCAMVFNCHFKLHFLQDWWYFSIFSCLSDMCTSCFLKRVFKSFALYIVFFYCYFILRVSYILLVQIICQIYALQIFSPSVSFVFLFPSHYLIKWIW